jgi:hypothetical protein
MRSNIAAAVLIAMGLAGCTSGTGGGSAVRNEVEQTLRIAGYGSVDVDTLSQRQVSDIYLVSQREEVGDMRSLVGAILRRE